jgi:2-octaprenylphenol hydroxylase
VRYDYDLITVGGGMVGAALACLLGERMTILLLDRVPPMPPAPNGDVGLRVSSVSPASRRLLAVAGAWDAIDASRTCPYRRMHVWESGPPRGDIVFDSAELGVPELGHIVENALIQHALLARATALPRVSLFAPAQPSALLLEGDAARIVLEDGRTFSSRLIVGADGASSNVRALAGIESTTGDYRQEAVVAHLRSERPHEATARQRFLPDGPLALLPLADGRSSIVWSTAPAHAQALLEMDADAFAAEVTSASESVLGRLTLASGRAKFPLRRQHAASYCATRVVLVGDAAHSVHPLAGLGVNLGFMDAAALAEITLDALDRGDDPGEPRALRRYERWRRTENAAYMTALDAFHRLFANADPLLTGLRATGLDAVDRLGPIKHAFARRAMGMAGDLPRIVRQPAPGGSL